MSTPLRGIVLADLHARRNSLEQNLAVLDYVEQRYKERKCSFFLSLGDLLHDRVTIHSKTWIRLRRRLKALPVHALYLKGNHDSPEDSYEMCILEQLDWKNATPVLEPTWVSSPLPMVLYPYDSDLKKPIIAPAGPLLLGGHFSVLGSKVGPEDWEILSGTDLKAIPEADLRVLGHHHKHQWLDDHTCYVGAPFPTSFGECNEDKIILEVGLDEKTGVFTTTPLQVPGLPRYYEVVVNSPEDLERVPPLIKGNRVRIVSTIPVPPTQEKEWKEEADSGGFQCLYVPPPQQRSVQMEIDPAHFLLPDVVQTYILSSNSEHTQRAVQLFDLLRSESMGEYEIKPGRIEFLWVHLQDFGPHVDTWVSLQKTGLVGIEGANVSSLEDALTNFSDEMVLDSNTAGKSHLFDAIVWALTGETISTGPRDSLDDLIRKGSSSCKVTLAVNIRGKYTEITRGRPKLLKLSVDHVDNTSHDLESEVKRHLGFGKETLVQTVLLGQRVRSLLHFMDLGDAEQRRLIDHHVGITILDAWIKSASVHLSEVEGEVVRLRQILEDSGLAVAEGMVTSHLQEAEVWVTEHANRIKAAEQALEDRRAASQSLLGELSEAKAEMGTLLVQLSCAAWEELSSREEYSELDQTLKDWEAYEKSLNGKLIALGAKRTSPLSRVKKIDQQILAGQSLCPECQQQVPKEHLLALKAGYEKELLALDTEISSIQDSLQECHEVLQEGRTDLDSLKGALSLTNTLSSSIREAEQAVRDLEREVAAQCAPEEQALVSVMSETNPHISALERSLAEVDHLKIKMETQQKDLDDQIREQGAWVLLLESLGYRSGKGVRMPIYAAFQSRLNDLLSGHCLRLSQNKYTVQVWLVDQKTNGEWVDKYRLVLIGENGEIPIKRASGGQLRRINLSFVLSLRELFEELCGVTCNFLGIDEVFDGLDSVGKDAIATLLPTLLERIESVWAISQEPQLQRLFSAQRLVCLNEGGTRTIVVPRGPSAERLLLSEATNDGQGGRKSGRGSTGTTEGPGAVRSVHRRGKLPNRV